MLLNHMPYESATSSAVLGDRVAWGAQEHLLALVVDTLRAANWQRSGNKNAPRPKPIRRPGSLSTDALRGKALDERLLALKRRHRRRKR